MCRLEGKKRDVHEQHKEQLVWKNSLTVQGGGLRERKVPAFWEKPVRSSKTRVENKTVAGWPRNATRCYKQLGRVGYGRRKQNYI